MTAAPRPLANIILEDDAIFPPYSVPHLSRFSIHQMSFLEIDLHNTGFLLGGGGAGHRKVLEKSFFRGTTAQPGELLLRREDGSKVQNAETVTERSIESMAAAAGSSQRRGL